jgi:hypothetical protein
VSVKAQVLHKLEVTLEKDLTKELYLVVSTVVQQASKEFYQVHR